MTTQDTNPQSTIDGAGDGMPPSGEPSGRSRRDSLTAPSPGSWLTVANCGKIFFALALGLMAGVFCFLLWAVLEHGTQ